MVGVFRHIFVVSNARSALLQTAYYGAYFTLAIPASFINRRFGYKTGVLTGLGVAAVGTQKPQGVWDQRLPPPREVGIARRRLHRQRAAGTGRAAAEASRPLPPRMHHSRDVTPPRPISRRARGAGIRVIPCQTAGLDIGSRSRRSTANARADQPDLRGRRPTAETPSRRAGESGAAPTNQQAPPSARVAVPRGQLATESSGFFTGRCASAGDAALELASLGPTRPPPSDRQPHPSPHHKPTADLPAVTGAEPASHHPHQPQRQRGGQAPGGT